MPQVPVVVLAMDSRSCLSVTSKGHQWALTEICMHTSYVFAILMKERSVKCFFKPTYQAYFEQSGLAILSNNGTKLKNAVLNDTCEELGIKKLYSNPFHPQGNLRIENVYNFLKRTLTSFLDPSYLEWDELLVLAHLLLWHIPW